MLDAVVRWASTPYVCRPAQACDIPDDGVVYMAVRDDGRHRREGIVSDKPWIDVEAYLDPEAAAEAAERAHGERAEVVAVDTSAAPKMGLTVDTRMPGRLVVWGRIPPEAISEPAGNVPRP